MKFCDGKEFSFINFDFKNRCENEFKDNNEKSCSRSKKRVSHKIVFKAIGTRNGHADSVRAKIKKNGEILLIDRSLYEVFEAEKNLHSEKSEVCHFEMRFF